MYRSIIITDPANVFHGEHFKHFVQNPEQYPQMLGLNNFLWGKVGVSDLNDNKHIILDTDSGKKLGEFVSESNMFCVIDAEQLFEFNPSFDFHVFEPWNTTLLQDFNSTNIFVQKRKDYLEVVGLGSFNFQMRSI